MHITFRPKKTDGECRCKKCGKLLARIKKVDKYTSIEIKCTRSHCKTLNVFEINLNSNYIGNSDATIPKFKYISTSE
jgi:phage FluMu protein Com